MEQQLKKKNNNDPKKKFDIIAVQLQPEKEGKKEDNEAQGNDGDVNEAEESVQRSSSIGNSSQSSSTSSAADFEICRLCEKQVAVEKFREHSAACLIGNELAFRASALDEEITQLVEELDSSIYWTSSVWLRNSATLSPSILTPVTPFLSNSGVVSLSLPTPTLGAIALIQQEKKDVSLLSEGEFSFVRNISKVAHQVIKIKTFSRDTIEKLTILLKEFQQILSPLNQNKFTEKSKQMCQKLQKLIEQKRDQYVSSFSACEALWPPFEADSIEYFQIAAQSFQVRYSDVIPSLEDFELIKPISKGAFGQVFLCRKKRTGDLFAMKVQKKEHIMRKQNVNRIEEEHTILRKTFNPFIVKLFYSFQTDDHLYLVLEYLPGGDCLSLLEHVGYLEESTVKMYIAELLLALDYLHGHGIVHRDLKPDNMLISADGHIKLTDFGLSAWGVRESAVQYQQTSNLVFGKTGASVGIENISSSSSVASNISVPFSSTSSQQPLHSVFLMNNNNNNNNVPSPIPSKQAISTPLIKSAASKTPLVPLTTRRQKALSIVGTPDYLAPEVLRGTGYGESADFWSVGIILYEFLVGVTPFASHSPEEVFAKALDENVHPFWPCDIEVSKEAKDLVSKLLVRDPKKRLGSQGGVKEIKAHPFFADVQWEMLLNKKTEPPFKPQLQTKEDTTYFDSRETSHPSVNIEAELSQLKIEGSTQEPTKKTSPNLNSPRSAEKKKAPNFRNFFFRNLIHLNEANEAIAERKIQHRASSVSVLQTKKRQTPREKPSISSPPRVHEEPEKEKKREKKKEKEKEKVPLKIPSIRELKEKSKLEEKSKSSSSSSPATPNILGGLAANAIGTAAEMAASPLNLLTHLKKIPEREESEKETTTTEKKSHEKEKEESCFGKCDSNSIATAMYPHIHLPGSHEDENSEKALGNVKSSPATTAFHKLRHLLSNKNRNYSI